MHAVISDFLQCSSENSYILPFYICIFMNFPHFIMCAGLFSFAIIIVEICLVFLWMIQTYPELHIDMYGDFSEDI